MCVVKFFNTDHNHFFLLQFKNNILSDAIYRTTLNRFTFRRPGCNEFQRDYACAGAGNSSDLEW